MMVGADQEPEAGGSAAALWIFVACVLVLATIGLSLRSSEQPVAVALRPLQVGVTHTQHTIEDWDPPEAQALARDLLRRTAPIQNQFIMGWGALNPEPAPGQYDWSSLDRLMELIRDTGGEPVIT
jgi:hypothetical protein